MPAVHPLIIPVKHAQSLKKAAAPPVLQQHGQAPTSDTGPCCHGACSRCSTQSMNVGTTAGGMHASLQTDDDSRWPLSSAQHCKQGPLAHSQPTSAALASRKQQNPAQGSATTRSKLWHHQQQHLNAAATPDTSALHRHSHQQHWHPPVPLSCWWLLTHQGPHALYRPTSASQTQTADGNQKKGHQQQRTSKQNAAWACASQPLALHNPLPHTLLPHTGSAPGRTLALQHQNSPVLPAPCPLCCCVSNNRPVGPKGPQRWRCGYTGPCWPCRWAPLQCLWGAMCGCGKRCVAKGCIPPSCHARSH